MTGGSTMRSGSDVLRRTLDRWWARSERAVILDLNGTLSDDEPLLLRIYTELFAEHLGWELTPDRYFAELAGRSDREIVESVVRQTGDDELAVKLLGERRRQYCALVEQGSPISPQSRRFVRRLADHGVPLGIVTGAQRVDVDFVLSRSGVEDLFSAVVTEEDVSDGKPNPEGFLLGARQLEAAPETVLVFEDSVPGLEAARAAGMASVAVEGTAAPERLAEHADAVVTALDPRLLDGLLKSVR